MTDPRNRLVVWMILLLMCGVGRAEERTPPVTALLGAFDIEVAILHEAVTGKQYHKHLGVTFTVGRLKGRRVVLAETGVGKVNAAMTTALLLDHFQPSEVIFTGIAGGIDPDLHPGDLVIGERTAQHDLMYLGDDDYHNFAVRNPVNGIRNPIMIPADKRLLHLAHQASKQIRLQQIVLGSVKRRPKIRSGVIVSGDAFVASSKKKLELRRRLNADAVEMEGAAVAQVCHQQEVPCLIVRSLSDRADQRARQEAQRFKRVAARNSAMFVMKTVELLARAKNDSIPDRPRTTTKPAAK